MVEVAVGAWLLLLATIFVLVIGAARAAHQQERGED
jgi:hypothetical protein